MLLKVRDVLSCAHKLTEHVRADSRCRNLHGHSYYVTVALSGPDDSHFLVDADDVKKALKKYDHVHLNEVFEEEERDMEPTLENFAKVLMDEVEGICPPGVTVAWVLLKEGEGAEVEMRRRWN